MGNMTNRGGHYVRKTYGPPHPYRSRYHGAPTPMDGAMGFVWGVIGTAALVGYGGMALAAEWDKAHPQEDREITCAKEQLITLNAEQRAMDEKMEQSLGSTACGPSLNKE